MKEDFLHYVWRFKRFNFLDLKTTSGDEIKIEYVGDYNTGAGPDFQNAKLTIRGTKWVGSVEMHLNASDWIKHKHTGNKDYNNVILHVVWHDDIEIIDAQDKIIPCLKLNDKVDLRLQNKYQQLLSSQLWIPCQENISSVNQIKIKSWIERLMIDRLEEKTELISKTFHTVENNWEQLLFILIAKVLGLKPNESQMEDLARSINVGVLFKHSDNRPQVESLLFGQSGLLSTSYKDNYPIALNKEYEFLSKKYQLSKPNFINWKLLRLRPSNFPTLRMSQLAEIYTTNNLMFDNLLQGSTSDILGLFNNIHASSYWDDHYIFDKKAENQKKKSLGKSRINIILINAIIPILFLYGKLRGEDKYIDKSLALLEVLPPEKNQIINNWKNLGVDARTAFDSQALIHLKTRFCAKQKCLQCVIGNEIMQQETKG